MTLLRKLPFRPSGPNVILGLIFIIAVFTSSAQILENYVRSHADALLTNVILLQDPGKNLLQKVFAILPGTVTTVLSTFKQGSPPAFDFLYYLICLHNALLLSF